MLNLDYLKDITIDDVESVAIKGEKIELSQQSYDNVQKSLEFLQSFAHDKIIYGVNTGFGPMAQYKIDDDKLCDLQYNLIRSHSSGAGEKIPDEYVSAVMLVRIRAIMQGHSGIDPTSIKLLVEFVNRGIYPVIREHGSVGASGDLVQLAHVALALLGEGEVSYKGKIRPTKEVFEELGLKPITVKVREGLSLINGTSSMTGIAAINVIRAKRLFEWTLLASAMLNEIVESFDDHFSKEYNNVKRHEGQRRVAELLRSILKDSKQIGRRDEFDFFKDNKDVKVFKRKVQEYYSLRCLPQILGPAYDTISAAEKVVTDEINSVSDNPIVDMESGNVYHGGNFHGDYISLEMDKLKLVVTRMSMLSERQSAFLFNSKVNDILPPFVNMGTLGLNLGMQGIQFTATSTTAESQTLSNSMYVHSITTNNDNQDIVSMGSNSALLTKRVIENTYQVLAIEMLGLAQAVDCLKIANKLSNYTRKVYDMVRAIAPAFAEDEPKYPELANIVEHMKYTKPEFPR